MISEEQFLKQVFPFTAFKSHYVLLENDVRYIVIHKNGIF